MPNCYTHEGRDDYEYGYGHGDGDSDGWISMNERTNGRRSESDPHCERMVDGRSEILIANEWWTFGARSSLRDWETVGASSSSRGGKGDPES